MGTALAVESGVGPLKLSGPQCRAIGSPIVDRSVLPLAETNLDDSNADVLFDVPAEVHRMHDFVRDAVRDEGALVGSMFATIAGRANIALHSASSEASSPVMDLTDDSNHGEW